MAGVVRARLTACVRARLEIACVIVGAGRRAGIRAYLLCQIAQSAVCIARDLAARLGDRDQLIQRVVTVARHAASWVRHLLQPAEFVVRSSCVAVHGRIDRRHLAIGVIAEGRGQSMREEAMPWLMPIQLHRLTVDPLLLRRHIKPYSADASVSFKANSVVVASSNLILSVGAAG